MKQVILGVLLWVIGPLFFAESLLAQSSHSEPKISAFLGSTVTRVASQDKFINGNGVNLGLQIGLKGEKYFGSSDNYAYTLGLQFSMNQGGVLNHRAGGNYLPNSELRPALKSGDMPLPPGVDIRYRLNFIEFPISLKLYTQFIKDWKYYAELPILSLGFRVRSSADITASGISEQKVLINKDMRWLFSQLGLGVGAQREILSGNAIYWGLYYHQSLLDLKRKNGWKFIDETRVFNDRKTILGQLSLRFGFVF